MRTPRTGCQEVESRGSSHDPAPLGLGVRSRGAIEMLLELSRDVEVAAAPEVVWGLIRNLSRLGGCVPGVSGLRELEPDRRYAADVSDKLGPFTLQVPVEIELRAAEEGRRIAAGLSGNDRRGQARVKGELEASLEPSGGGTRLRL